MDMPQESANENQYFFWEKGKEASPFDYRAYQI